LSSSTISTALPLIAIAGNPNTGKTSIFNRLTGQNLKVGNYPGVTVERYECRAQLVPGRSVRMLDVPGTYSLSARSVEEQIAIAAIAGIPPHSAPDVTVLVIDATQLTRNLYLALQVIETGGPVVIALNMVDMLESLGQRVDADALEKFLGVPVAPVSGLSGMGIEVLRRRIAEVLEHPEHGLGSWSWKPTTPELVADMEAAAAALPSAWLNGNGDRRHAFALWALLSLDEEDELRAVPATLREVVNERRELAQRQGREIEVEIIQRRYGWIDQHSAKFLHTTRTATESLTERIDAVLLHPAVGFAIFLVVMAIVFQSLFSWSDPAISAIESSMGALAGGVESILPAGIARDFLVDGVIGGVGSVIVFLPQILLLFFFIGLMEDTGYMARVAFLMDRIMRVMGLHGRAFVPMLSGFACAVPAIMATRTMERQRDRLLTMMVIPLMTCSARLPVYTLIIAALFPPAKVFGLMPVQGLLLLSMYLFSTVTALTAAAVFSRTVFKAPHVPLILELPPYRLPHWMSVVRMMWMRGSVFLREAGRIILLCSIGLWVLLNFPRSTTHGVDDTTLRQQAQTSNLPAADEPMRSTQPDAEQSGAAFRHSYGARVGKFIEPGLRPLGFDWKIGIGLIGAFAAREVFVSTMGVVYGVGDQADETSVTLRQKIRSEIRSNGKPVYTPLVGLSLMIFFALACQCMSTIAAVRRETRTWRWPAFLFTYMTILAWTCSFLVFQGGKLLGFQ
jgi:ferrous iron transport protein B